MLVRPSALLPLLALVLAPLPAPDAAAQTRRFQRQSYPVSGFVIEYALPHAEHPPVEELFDAPVELTRTRGGYVAPGTWDPRLHITLGEIAGTGARFYPSGLRQVSHALVEALGERGISGVLVTVPEIDEETGADLRPEGRTALLLRVWTGRVIDVRTFADGDRYDELPMEERINHPDQTWVLEDSPVEPGGRRGLLRARAIEDHARRLSRHPGRRVDAELSPGSEPGTTTVTYRVSEQKPWFAYAQWSNTGTEQTTRSRPRFGFVHNQLTGHDDILRLDYVTGDFHDVHGVSGAYEAPVPRVGPLRWRVSGSWSRYDASEVGLSFANFKGRHWDAGADLVWQAFQWRDVFVDLSAGAQWVHEEVDNTLFGSEGKEDFFLPRFGLEVERQTLASSLRFDSSLEFNVPQLAGTDTSEIERLGRLYGDEDFALLRWDASYDFYLESVLWGQAWADPSTPTSSTLAHELSLGTRGQTTFGQRVAPQFQQVVGGLYTVRGYDQALTAGDTVLMGSAEYRFHLPRLLFPEPTPRWAPVIGEFRAAPQYVYGRPDWDLILRAFFDIAYVKDADRLGFEPNDTLMGAGVGVELQLLRNLSVRYDFGLSLTTAGGLADRYDDEHYVVVTLLY